MENVVENVETGVTEKVTTKNDGESIENTNTQQEVKTFTEEEVNKKVQSEADRVRTEYTKKMKALEAELAALKPAEKSEAELKLEQKLADIEAKEREIANKERQFKIAETLESNGLPKQLAKYLQGAEDVESYVKEVSEVLNNHLLNNSFKPSTHKANEGITKEEFKKMSYSQKEKLYNENPDLFKKLSTM